MQTPKIVVITQARIGSSRLPSKVLRPLGNSTLLQCHLDRIKASRTPDAIVVATTTEDEIEPLLQIATKTGTRYFQGSTTDVLDRFYRAAVEFRAEIVVRVTSDCPLIDGALLDSIVQQAIERDVDYCSNVLVESYPDGQDIEVIKFSALERAWRDATLQSDREHVTPYIRRNSDFVGGDIFRALNVECEEHYGEIRMTVDEAADLEAIETLIGKLGTRATWRAYADYVRANPHQFSNQTIIRNEGLKQTSNDVPHDA